MADDLARLRQALRHKLEALEGILEPAFDRAPIFPGRLYASLHTCGKPNCRCATLGELHEALRLQIRFADGTANRCVSPEDAEHWRPRTEAYKRLRDVQRGMRKWQGEVLELLEKIEHARRSPDGLLDEDRKRPLR